MTILTNFDNSDHFWQFWPFLKLLTIWTIFTFFDNFDNSDNCFCHFDNWKDNPEDLWHLRHWLQFWQLRTWIMTIFVTWQLIVTLDSIRNSCDVFVNVRNISTYIVIMDIWTNYRFTSLLNVCYAWSRPWMGWNREMIAPTTNPFLPDHLKAKLSTACYSTLKTSSSPEWRKTDLKVGGLGNLTIKENLH